MFKSNNFLPVSTFELDTIENEVELLDRPLPRYDKDHKTRRLCILGLITSLIISIICIGYSIQIFRTNELGSTGGLSGLTILYNLKGNSGKAITYLFLIIMTACTESLGYIHTITLRWALAHEGRLDFNSNLRLFSVASKSTANGTFANVLSVLFLIMSYAGVSQILVPTDEFTLVNAVGLLMVGIGLLGLGVITAIGLSAGERKGDILSWNPNALNTTLACLHRGILTRRPGRTLVPASQYTALANPTKPNQRQPSARATSSSVLSHIVRFLLAITFLACVLAASIIGLVVNMHMRFHGSPLQWAFLTDTSNIGFGGTAKVKIGDNSMKESTALFIAFLFGAGLQAFSTLALHITELVVNLRRDEAEWRQASTARGATLAPTALRAAFSNTGSLLLLVLKPLAQWIWGLGAFVVISSSDDNNLDNGVYIGCNPLPLFVVCGITIILSAYAIIASRKSPYGPQPSTYGRMQTMADLVDDWGKGVKGRIWWGDKGAVGSDGYGKSGRTAVRRAGTAGKKDILGIIRMEEFYI